MNHTGLQLLTSSRTPWSLNYGRTVTLLKTFSIVCYQNSLCGVLVSSFSRVISRPLSRISLHIVSSLASSTVSLANSLTLNHFYAASFLLHWILFRSLVQLSISLDHRRFISIEFTICAYSCADPTSACESCYLTRPSSSTCCSRRAMRRSNSNLTPFCRILHSLQIFNNRGTRRDENKVHMRSLYVGSAVLASHALVPVLSACIAVSCGGGWTIIEITASPHMLPSISAYGTPNAVA